MPFKRLVNLTERTTSMGLSPQADADDPFADPSAIGDYEPSSLGHAPAGDGAAQASDNAAEALLGPGPGRVWNGAGYQDLHGDQSAWPQANQLDSNSSAPGYPAQPEQPAVGLSGWLQERGWPVEHLKLASAEPCFGGKPLRPLPSSSKQEGFQRPTPYVLRGELERGPNGVVLRATDPDLGRDLALHVLEPDPSPAQRARFLRSARLGAQLNHPGIPKVLEWGWTDSESPYFATAWYEGPTLAALFYERRDPADNLRHNLKLFARLCEVIAGAHLSGVVHRDLRPTRVTIGDLDEVLVDGWGWSRVGREEKSPPLNDDPGARPYRAPELRSGEAGDERSDVFSLGALLWEILTDHPGPRSDSPSDPILARLQNCEVEPEWIELAERCRARDAWLRPRDAHVLLCEVREIARGTEARLDRAREEVERARRQTQLHGRRLRSAMAATCTVLLLLSAGAAALLWNSGAEVFAGQGSSSGAGAHASPWNWAQPLNAAWSPPPRPLTWPMETQRPGSFATNFEQWELAEQARRAQASFAAGSLANALPGSSGANSNAAGSWQYRFQDGYGKIAERAAAQSSQGDQKAQAANLKDVDSGNGAQGPASAMEPDASAHADGKQPAADHQAATSQDSAATDPATLPLDKNAPAASELELLSSDLLLRASELEQGGRVDEAVTLCEEWLVAQPEALEVRERLVRLLLARGRFEEALVQQQLAHPTADNSELKRLAEASVQLGAFLNGGALPELAGERALIAQVAFHQASYALASSLFAGAFASDAGLTADYRLLAARSAALAAQGNGQFSESLNADDRRRLRVQGLEWLQDEFDDLRQLYFSDGGQAQAMGRLKRILKDPDLDGLRLNSAAAETTAWERESIASFWQDLDAWVSENE